MKLKTLKDLIILCNDCKKDIDCKCIHPCCRNHKRVKQGIIKWVKECDKPYFKREYPFSELSGKEECEAVQFILKHIHNITEEDLK